jgi:hypothetical protein
MVALGYELVSAAAHPAGVTRAEKLEVL